MSQSKVEGPVVSPPEEARKKRQKTDVEIFDETMKEMFSEMQVLGEPHEAESLALCLRALKTSGVECGDDDPMIVASPEERLGHVNVQAGADMGAAAVTARKVANWTIIVNQMVANNATNVGGLGVMFKFNTWQDKLDAQIAMKAAIPWAFFIGPASAAVMNVPAGVPTVSAGILTFYSAATVRATSSNENFFMM